MAQKSRSNNKANFQTGDIPNQSNYVDLIDSFAVLTNDTNSGSLTLSGSLITSGSINHNGSTVFGDSSTDTHTITGNITASGGISSSGTIIGNVGTFTSYTNANFGSSNFSTTGTSTFDNITASGDISASGEIIVGGNISASGIIYAEHLYSSDDAEITDNLIIGGHITSSGNISSSGVVSVGNGSATDPSITFGSDTNTGIYKHSDDQLGLVAGGKTNIQLGTNAVKLKHDDNIKLETTSSGVNITGNISASGIITAKDGTNNGFHIGTGEVALDANSNDLRLGVDATWTGITLGKANAPTKNISLHGPVTASGDISSSGTVIGLSGSFNNLAYGGTDLSVSATELNYWDGLTSAEATQVKNIAGNTISGTQWSYLGQLNQSLTSTSTVSFAGVSMSSHTTFNGTFSLGALEMSATKSFLVIFTDVDTIPAGETSNQFTFINNSRVLSTSVVIGNVVEQDLIVDIMAVVDGGFKILLKNPRTSTFSGGTCKINFIVL